MIDRCKKNEFGYHTCDLEDVPTSLRSFGKGTSFFNVFEMLLHETIGVGLGDVSLWVVVQSENMHVSMCLALNQSQDRMSLPFDSGSRL